MSAPLTEGQYLKQVLPPPSMTNIVKQTADMLSSLQQRRRPRTYPIARPSGPTQMVQHPSSVPSHSDTYLPPT